MQVLCKMQYAIEIKYLTLKDQTLYIVHFNLSVYFNWLYYSKEVYGRATNGVMTQHEVKCTPNNQCKCIVSMKKRVCYYVKCTILFK